MTTLPSGPTHSVFDLTLAIEDQRVAGLRAATRRSEVAAPHGIGLGARVRNTIGHRLIAIGSALVEPPARRRPLPR